MIQAAINRLGAALVLLLSAGLASCASSGQGMGDVDTEIPDTAFEIHLYSDRSPDDYLGFIRRRLEMQGFDVVRYSAVDQNMATAALGIGRQLTLSVFVTVTHDEDVSRTRAVFSGIQGRPGASPGDDPTLVGAARWNTLGDDQAYAFGRLAQIVNRIEHEQIVYAVEQ